MDDVWLLTIRFREQNLGYAVEVHGLWFDHAERTSRPDVNAAGAVELTVADRGSVAACGMAVALREMADRLDGGRSLRWTGPVGRIAFREQVFLAATEHPNITCNWSLDRDVDAAEVFIACEYRIDDPMNERPPWQDGLSRAPLGSPEGRGEVPLELLMGERLTVPADVRGLAIQVQRRMFRPTGSG